MKRASNRTKSFLAILLMILSGLPRTSPATVKTETRNTVIIVPVGNKDSSLAPAENKIIDHLVNRLKAQANVLPSNAAKQIYDIAPVVNDRKLTHALQRMNQNLNDYAAFAATSRETIAALESLSVYLQEEVPPSEQASEIMVSSILTRAWLLFQEHDKVAAQKLLSDLVTLSPASLQQLSTYPPNFRKFVATIKGQTPDASHELVLKTIPEAAHLYINHVFVGVSPLSLRLPPNKYRVGFAAYGRKPVSKDITLDGDRGIRTSLSWQRGPDQTPLPPQHEWGQMKLSERMVLASRLSSATNADVVVFLSIPSKDRTITPQALVYDARYSQFLKPIIAPATESLHKINTHRLTDFFAQRISPLITTPSLSHRSNKIDQEIVVDHRLAHNRNKPLYKKTLFWVVTALGISAITGTVIALSQQNRSLAGPASGSVIVPLDGF